MNDSIKLKSDWFENWFDSPYYHILYKHRDDKEARFFIDNLCTFLNHSEKSTLLDLGCGKGRHSIYFSEKGFDTTGIDLSKQSIAHAINFEKENLSFFEHDMRIPFRINYFDVVMNLFTSFGYFEAENDNFKTIHSVASALKKGGRLIIDFLNAEKSERELIPIEIKTVDDIQFKISKKIEDGFLIKEIDFSDQGIAHSFHEKVKLLRVDDFNKYFSACGLELKTTFGNYALDSFDSYRSDRLILVAEKM